MNKNPKSRTCCSGFLASGVGGVGNGSTPSGTVESRWSDVDVENVVDAENKGALRNDVVAAFGETFSEFLVNLERSDIGSNFQEIGHFQRLIQKRTEEKNQKR
jgi:hypothetical protein